MTARARACAWRRPAADRFVTRVLLLLLAGAPAPASAEVGAQVSLFSDDRFRGYSLSGGHPVAAVDLSYDHPGGLYADVSATAVVSSSDVARPLGLQFGGGYVRQVSGVTLEAGALHSEYSHYGRWANARSYTELYAGAAYRFLSARVAYSPHYFEPGSRSLYGEVATTFSPARKINLAAHAGLLVPVDYREGSGRKRVQYDWRLGVAREVRGATLHAIASGGGPGRDLYGGREHHRTALVIGLSLPL